MLPDRVSNPGPLTYESDALPIALRGPAWDLIESVSEGFLTYSSIAHFSLLPIHHPDMTEILLKRT